MFISNTATAAMMAPIAQSVVDQLALSHGSTDENRSPGTTEIKRLSTGLLLCIAFAANIGGTGTIPGTPSNIVMIGRLHDLYHDSGSAMNYVKWLVFAFPLMCICVLLAWATLAVMFLRKVSAKSDRLSSVIRKRYEELPSISFAEISVLICFCLLLLLWILRDPGFFKGIKDLFPQGFFTDATAAMMVALLLFALPSQTPRRFKRAVADTSAKAYNDNTSSTGSRLMDWPTMQQCFPWNILLLLGGGFALAHGVESSGLSAVIADVLSSLSCLPMWLLQVVVMTTTMLVTNICSNSVTAVLFVNIASHLAVSMQQHPFKLMLPTTLACSFAFILPVGTPPNAIVFSCGNIRLRHMVSVGFLISLECLVLTVVYMNSLALVLVPMEGFPAWAHPMKNVTSS